MERVMRRDPAVSERVVAKGSDKFERKEAPRPGRTVVVLPTYNEAKNLPLMVEALVNLSLPDLHILVVDDDSPDGTGLIAEALRKPYPQVHVIHRPDKQGLGTAYVEGFKWALDMGADYIVQMDADLSHEPARIPQMLDFMDGNDVVVGSRYVKGGEVDPAWSRSRRLLSAFANLYARTILRSKVNDITGGFKCWKRSALEKIDLDSIRSNGYAFMIEMNHRCQALGLQVEEYPIHFYERSGGVSKMSRAVILEAAWRVWEIRFRTLARKDEE